MLSDKQFSDAAERLAVAPAALRAFVEVEAGGDGFLKDGRPKILFERHIFYRRLVAARGQSYADATFKKFPDICNPSAGGYAKGANADARGIAEHERLSRAADLDRTCALESCSWGAGQVMGYHWKTCKYPTLQAFINDAYKEAGQLEIMVRFLEANPAIVGAMKRKDWAAVARGYNGPNYGQNSYDTKLESAYKKYGGA